MRSSLWHSDHLVSFIGTLFPQSSTTANSSEPFGFKTFLGRSPPNQRPLPTGKPKLGKRSLCCLAGNRALALLKAPAADRFLQHLHLHENVRKLSLVRRSLKMLTFSFGRSLSLCSLHLSLHSGCWRRLQDIGHEPKPAPRFHNKCNYCYSLMPNLWSHCLSAVSVTKATVWLQLTQAKFWKQLHAT